MDKKDPHARKLPLSNTPEAKELCSLYPSASHEQVAIWARNYGYKSKHGFINAMRKRLGIRRIVRESLPIEAQLPIGLSPLELQVLNIVRQGSVSVGEISRQIDRSSETVIKTMDSLREKHYEVNLDDISRLVEIPQIPSKTFMPTEFKYFKKFYRIGIVSDTQMCSKYQQVSLLHDAYKDFDERQTDFNLHAGDLDDGEGMYRGHTNEVFKHGADQHRDYIVENYPTSKRGRRTYVIGGQHDFCWYKQNGHNILEAICKKRKDLVYRGFFDAKFKVKGMDIGLHHPGGGVAYARSYKIQKYIENMVGYIASIPTAKSPILQLLGHWHIPCHLPSYMGIDAMSLPCFQSQTPYLAEKGLMPTVGYAIAEIYLDKDDNLTATKVEFVIQNAYIKKDDY